ncbi:hypothetical protein GTQ34_10260 [Muricauda sp. JGD-17]|uniref:Uncharacterized protein n=1 Tax=Flagellimonas ochracea TaxID=2696472 RepID=A0A964WXX1_9FLAO|nr:hypothetical protein [Allomuricauda ochracea]NAY92302.1 hypothetical protein [Allomuricauda ochracea]
MAAVSITTTILFILTTFLTLWFFHKAGKNKGVLLGLLIWMIITGLLGIFGFYSVENAMPPRFIFLLGPGMLFVVFLLITKKGRSFVDMLDLKWLTLLHVVRVPVEIVLYYIFLEGLVPELMTFEGWNYDIISGLSAPIIFYLVFVQKWIGRNALLLWNFICLGLLLNILTIAVLSAQTPFQQLAFEQPNIGVAYFPFVWLPTLVVPLVLVSHLASIRQLLHRKTI